MLGPRDATRPSRPGTGRQQSTCSRSCTLKQHTVHAGGNQSEERRRRRPRTRDSTAGMAGGEDNCGKAKTAFGELGATGRLARQPGFKPPDCSTLPRVPAGPGSRATPFSAGPTGSSHPLYQRPLQRPLPQAFPASPPPLPSPKGPRHLTSPPRPRRGLGSHRASDSTEASAGSLAKTPCPACSLSWRSLHIGLQLHLGFLTERTPVRRLEPQRGLFERLDCPQGSRDSPPESQEICPGCGFRPEVSHSGKASPWGETQRASGHSWGPLAMPLAGDVDGFLAGVGGRRSGGVQARGAGFLPRAAGLRSGKAIKENKSGGSSKLAGPCYHFLTA